MFWWPPLVERPEHACSAPDRCVHSDGRNDWLVRTGAIVKSIGGTPWSWPRPRRNRRHGAADGRGTEGVRWSPGDGADANGSAEGRHAIPRSPDAVVPANGRPEVADTIARRRPELAALSNAAERERGQQHDRRCDRLSPHRPPHFGTSSFSPSGHSRRPKGAPCGSATMASLPPWRSRCGSTSTRPPSATACAAILVASSTRT